MEEEKTEVKNPSEPASTEEGVETTENNDQSAPTDEGDDLKKLEEIQSLLAAEREAKVKAEGAVVKYKKMLKDAGVDEGEDSQDISQIVEKAIDKKLEPILSKIQQKDEGLDKANTLISELKTSLIANKTKSKTGLGSNQDKPVIEEDLTKRIGDADRAVYQRIADRKRIPLKDYLKTLPEFKK